MEAFERRYDIDWLRVIAIGLLLIYHTAIGFQPWGVLIGFIQTNEPMESIWLPMAMLNVWRIPILFFVSGMGVCFAMNRRNWKQLIAERSKRILIPYLFGILAIVPIHVIFWQDYYHQELQYVPNPGHLWFLGNIFVYVLLLSPLFFYLKQNKGGILHQKLNWLMGNPLGLLMIIGAFVAEAVLMQPDNFEMYAMTWHGFALGFVAFLFGYLCVYCSSFWRNIQRWKWFFVATATILYGVRLFVYELQGVPNFLLAIESCLWIFGVFAFVHRYFNKGGKTLRYLSEAAYPIYIIHMIFLYWGSNLLFAMDISVAWQFILVNIFTFAGSFLCYEYVIKRVPFLRPLFGLKLKQGLHPAKVEKVQDLAMEELRS